MEHAKLPMYADAAVVFEDVSVTLEGVSILEQVSASVPRGGCTAVVGPNGAGKTTLLMALLGEVPYQGHIRLVCRAGRGCNRIGYVPQRLMFDRAMPLSVIEFLAMGAQRLPLWFGVRKARREQALDLLGSVKAAHLAGRRLGALSGGELQRVLLALALQQDPDLLVLDEPAAGVDLEGGQVFCEVLEHLRRERSFTQLMVSHDLGTVTHHATHVIGLNRRVVAQGPPREVLTNQSLSAVFGPHMGLFHTHAPVEPCTCVAGHAEKGHD
ncbi:MAG: metal ABC transporter ATP-binding protein [Syntrophaceae bacterium]